MSVKLNNGLNWIKDFFTPRGSLTARFYRVETEPEGKYELMYSNCMANISILYIGDTIRIGSITYSIHHKNYDKLFIDQARSMYQIPKYITTFILSYFRQM